MTADETSALRAAIGVELLAALNRMGAGPKLMAAIGTDIGPGDVYADMDSLGADREFLAVIGGYGDMTADVDILQYLKEWNADRPVINH